MFVFEYHDGKAKINLIKHKVSFEEAKSVFYDLNGMEFFDTEHSDSEDRFINIGCSSKQRVLFVSFTIRDNVYRIISAKKLTNAEIRYYGYKWLQRRKWPSQW